MEVKSVHRCRMGKNFQDSLTFVRLGRALMSVCWCCTKFKSSSKSLSRMWVVRVVCPKKCACRAAQHTVVTWKGRFRFIFVIAIHDLPFTICSCECRPSCFRMTLTRDYHRISTSCSTLITCLSLLAAIDQQH